MANWEEVRLLAASFQQIQSSSSTFHKLSERNCIELITKLSDMKLLEVMYTLDGREYVTPECLEAEIRREVNAHKGRVNIVNLHQILNIDLSYVEAKVSDILKCDKDFLLLQGDLISRSYMDRVCEEINDKLQVSGQVVITELSREFRLPLDFINQSIKAAMGTIIFGHLEEREGGGVIYTEAYVSRYKSRIRGHLSAVTKPTDLSSVVSSGHYSSKLFQSVFNQLVGSGDLCGVIHGRGEKASFIPAIYTNMQIHWLNSFLSSNGYLAFDSLTRLGVENPKDFIIQNYMKDGGDVVLLNSCCIGSSIQTEVEAAIEETDATNNWVDIEPFLPPSCTHLDTSLLLKQLFKDRKNILLFGSIYVSDNFIHSCYKMFDTVIKDKAKKAWERHKFHTREDIDVAPMRTAGNEKKGKRSRQARQIEYSEPDFRSYVNRDKIKEVLEENLMDSPEQLISGVAEKLERSLQDLFVKEVKAVSDTTSSTIQQRKQHSKVQEKIQGLWNILQLCEKSLRLFSDDVNVQISKHLLRTVCSVMTNTVLVCLLEDNGFKAPCEDEEIDSEERVLLTSKLPRAIKVSVMEVNTSLNGKNISAFFQKFEALCSKDFCEFVMKKVDRKKERQLIFNHQKSILENIRTEREPSMALHLVTIFLFQQYTNTLLDVPGRIIPRVIDVLCSHMKRDDHMKLLQYQKLIVEQMNFIKDRDSSVEIQQSECAAYTQLMELLDELKRIALNFS